jgi:tetratricopeptide (TPR) repeat protein
MNIRATLVYLLLAFLTADRALAETCGDAASDLAVVFNRLRRGETSSAERALQPIRAAHPDCPEVILALARVAAANGDTKDAEGLFMRYLQQVPEDPRAYTYFGRFLIAERRYDQADAWSAMALEKSPQDPGAMSLRGQILDMKGQSKQALDLLERASAADPEDPDTQFCLGSIYDRAKQPADAVTHFAKAVAIDPHNARAYDYLALNLEPLGELAQAEQAYKKALDTNRPGPHFDAFLDYNYGRFLLKRDDLDASKLHFDRAVELAPQVRAVWYERAKLHLQLQEYEQARSDAEKAASIADPAGIIIDLQMYSLLERIYRRLGKAELARKYADLSKQASVPVRGEHR